jgi:hypothetical protein
MFGMDMIDTYEGRKVARYESDALIISTARVTDSSHPYETAISHPAFNSGKWIIVELYYDAKAAEAGHEKWRGIMNDELPTELRDVSTSAVVEFGRAVGAFTDEDLTFSREES